MSRISPENNFKPKRSSESNNQGQVPANSKPKFLLNLIPKPKICDPLLRGLVVVSRFVEFQQLTLKRILEAEKNVDKN